MELRVSSYGSRAELEAYCERLEPDQKEGLSIVGTFEELARFQLGPTTNVHSIPVRLDEESVNIFDIQERHATNIARIKAKGYGLNGQLTELK